MMPVEPSGAIVQFGGPPEAVLPESGNREAGTEANARRSPLPGFHPAEPPGHLPCPAPTSQRQAPSAPPHVGVPRVAGQKADAGLASLAEGDTAAACGQLDAMINQLNASVPTKSSQADADALIADVTRIRAIIGC